MVTGKFKSLQLYRVIKERNKLSTSFFSYLNLSFYISNLWIWITIELYKKKKEIAIFQHLLLSIPISLTKKFLFKYSVKYTDTHKYKIISSHDSPENSETYRAHVYYRNNDQRQSSIKTRPIQSLFQTL